MHIFEGENTPRDIKSGLVGELIHRFADYVFRESKAPVSDESGVENCCMEP